ncbi:MAG: hypothetical protein EA406_12955 [Rhodospirillales bacterium]|nr:MAG: hypothetical protein EA406_12955 [Rhodospirillales bacterium]
MTLRNKILNSVATFALVAAIAGTAGAAAITSGAIKIEKHQVTSFANNAFFNTQPYDAIWNQLLPATVSIAAPAPGFARQLAFSFVYQEAGW